MGSVFSVVNQIIHLGEEVSRAGEEQLFCGYTKNGCLGVTDWQFTYVGRTFVAPNAGSPSTAGRNLLNRCPGGPQFRRR